ncbi:ABC transporter permease [Serinibacter arcticus]|uniref:Putative ABC transporter integral membrane protein n=1 Tax=Serinibacter arcticus TaxID=1655435 RepID=A0A4Z1EAG5_9MICO|nr:FtsX-like permease family protein [Serinibacter arcticus]TGO06391.1 putative ABC transporter integral membrane protein [Serinibacter arcticus]
MLRVALRGIRAHLVRFLLSLLAVALGVAFVAGTFALRSMLSGTFDGIVEASTPADAYVRGLDPAADASDDGDDGGTAAPAGGPGAAFGSASPGVPLTLIEAAAAADDVAAVIPVIQGSVVLVGADGTAVAAGQAPSLALVYSADDPSITLLAGSAPVGDGEIALESGALAASGLAPGDTTTVVLGGEIREVTVTGEVGYSASFAGATLVLLPQDVALAVYAPDGLVSQLAVFGADGATQDDVVASVTRALAGLDAGDAAAAGVEVVTGEDVVQENKDAIGTVLGFITTFLLVFAAIALFVGAFIISNTFAMSVRQRMREFALLRAVGASPVQVFASILVQAAVVGLVGSALGVAGGLGLVELLRAVLGSMGMELAGDVPLDAASVGLSLGVGTLVSVVAAAIPARRAALVPPVEAMRDDVTTPEAPMHRRLVVGLVLALGGAAALAAAMLRPDSGRAGLLLGVGAGAVVVAMLALAPAIATAVVRVLAWPLVRALPPMGRLARGNVVRNPRRTASTAGALMIGMALVGAATVIASTTQASVADVVAQEVDADLVLRSAGAGIPAGAVTDVRALDDVATADAFAFAALAVAGPDETGDGGDTGDAVAPAAGTIVVGATPGTFGRTMTVTTVDGDLATLADGLAAVNQTVAGEDWRVGDTLRITSSTGSHEVQVGAVVTSQGIGGSVVVDADVLDTWEPPQAQVIDTVFVRGTTGDVEALRTEVAAAVSPYIVVSVMTSDEFVSDLAAQVDQILVILYALLGLSIVIAVLGIVNTLALSVIERTREIGLLRAVGLGRLQLAATITIESVLTAVFGTAIGLAVGVGLASTLPTLFADQGLSQLAIPWGSLLAMLALAVVVGVLAALWPGVRAARLRVLDAVSYE